MIKITDNWAIERDEYCLILKRRVVSKKGKNAGKEKWTTYGYYRDLPQIVKAMVDKELFSVKVGEGFTFNYHSSLENIVSLVKKHVSRSLQEEISEK